MAGPNPAAGPDLAAAERAVEALRFLGDRHRLQMLQLLAERESCVSDLIAAVALPQPLVSYHLRRLREVGVVRTRRQAQWVFYSLDPEAWACFTQPIRDVLPVAELPAEARYGAADAATCPAGEREGRPGTTKA